MRNASKKYPDASNWRTARPRSDGDRPAAPADAGRTQCLRGGMSPSADGRLRAGIQLVDTLVDLTGRRRNRTVAAGSRWQPGRWACLRSDEMSLMDRCADGFDVMARLRGRLCYRQRKVTLSHNDKEPGIVRARVLGFHDEPYRVSVDWRKSLDGQLLVSCTCERTDKNKPCKHVWATLLAVDQGRFANRAAGSGRVQVVCQDAGESPQVLPFGKPARPGGVRARFARLLPPPAHLLPRPRGETISSNSSGRRLNRCPAIRAS